MARIRNIKPDLFRHEHLQDLEAAHPGAYIILTYIALWTQCDANGNFPWRPRLLKLDILPFIPYDLEATMHILTQHQYIQPYQTPDGQPYGHIPTFNRHQRITGKEATEGQKYPKPPGKQPGNNGETTEKHPDAQEEERITGKDNREREGVNTRAREDNFQKQKTNTDPATPPQPPTPGATAPLHSGEGSGVGLPTPLPDRIHATIAAWAETDHGLQHLKAWKRDTGYSDRIHGPTTGELRKFIAHHLAGKNRDRIISDPITHFTEQFPGWLSNATQFNRPKRQPTNEPPPPPQRRPTNGNATTVAHIGDITQKIVTNFEA